MSPIGSGRIGRLSSGPKFVPLSQFFFQNDQTKTKKKSVASGRAIKEQKRLRKPWEAEHKCHYCKDLATTDLLWAEARAYLPVCDKHKERGRRQIMDQGNEIDYERKVKKVSEGMTATVNVPVLPVPIGGGEKKRDNKKSKLSSRISKLLRDLF